MTSIAVKLRRAGANKNTFVGGNGEINPDPAARQIRLGDGVTPGGIIFESVKQLGSGVLARPTGTWKPGGTFGQSGAGDVTRHMTLGLLHHVYALRIRALHAYADVMTGIKFGVAWSANVVDPNTPTGAWSPVTFAGAASVNLSGTASGAGASAVATIVESDLLLKESIAVDAGIANPYGNRLASILMLRSYQPAAMQLSRFELTYYPSFPAGAMHTSFQTAHDGVTTPGGYTGSGGSNTPIPPVEIITYGASDVRTVLACGASTISGVGDAETGVGRGWIWRATALITDKAISHSNCAYSGQSTVDSLREGLVHLVRVKPHAAVFGPWSTNDPDAGTAAGDARQIMGMITWIEACRALGVVPMLCTFQSFGGLTAEKNASRDKVNAAVRQICATGAAILLDVEDVCCTGGGFRAGYTTDGVHPSGTLAQPALAAYAAPRIAQAVGAVYG